MKADGVRTKSWKEYEKADNLVQTILSEIRKVEGSWRNTTEIRKTVKVNTKRKGK